MNRATSLAALGAAALVAGSGARASAQTTTVRVGAVPADSLSPLLYAMRTGMFEKAGLTLELQTFGGGDAVTQAMLGGALDIALTSLVSLMQAHQRGIPLFIIAPGGLWIDCSSRRIRR
jgi:NitT/TauT family transport system substrate-binding protein